MTVEMETSKDSNMNIYNKNIQPYGFNTQKSVSFVGNFFKATVETRKCATLETIHIARNTKSGSSLSLEMPQSQFDQFTPALHLQTIIKKPMSLKA